MKKIVILGLAIFAFATVNAQIKKSETKSTSKSPLANISVPIKAKLVEEVKPLAGQLVIPYKKYKLPNGLTIIIHEDHSDPVVYVDVTYHVGSAREQQGRSGFAHFFEHMMFQGSKHIGDEMHMKYISEAGGELNGTTNIDRTNYFEALPSNNLEMALWLESDRMAFLLDSVTQQKFEVQRSTVKNERGQRYDNAPYGLVAEKINEALYPQGHPYSWSTIGYIADLDRVDVNDLKRFYMRWYGPNNATLTIAGDLNTEKALLLIEKYFGGIPSGPEVKPQTVAAVKLPETRYVSYEDNVKFPLIRMAWPTVPAFSKDEAALDALATILYGGKSSPFYQTFIKDQKASGIMVYNTSSELGGKFEINLRGNKDAKLADLEAEVKKIFTDFENKGFSEDELKKYKAEMQSNFYDGLTSVKGKGSRLAAYQTFLGNPNYLNKDLSRYLKVTKADIIRVYNTYIKGQKPVVLSCVPKGKTDLIAAADNWKMYERKIESESAEYNGLQPRLTEEKFNWSLKPASGTRPVVKPPVFWKEKLANGVEMIGSSESEIPKVNILITIDAGHRFEEGAKSGTSYLMADLLNESSLVHSAEEISDLLDKMGSRIDVSSNNSEINISVSCLAVNLPATLKIAEEMMFKPKFDTAEFSRVKKELLDRLTNQASQAGPIADNVFNRLLYGNGHILSYPATGTIATATGITIDDVKSFYNTFMNPTACKVVVVGDAKKEVVLKELGFLANWKGSAAKVKSQPALPSVDKTRIYFVDKKGAAQSEIRLGFPSNKYDATGVYYKSNVVNYQLAGNFNSRLNGLLREIKGYTYGIKGRFSGDEYEGIYSINAGVRSNVTDSSVYFVLNEVKKYRDEGMAASELDFTKGGMSNSEALKYETPVQKMYFLKHMMKYNLASDFTAQQNAVLEALSISDVNKLAKENLTTDKMIIVIVGDKETNLEKIKKLGYEVLILNTDGDPIK